MWRTWVVSAWACCLAVACAGLVMLARSDDVERPLLVLVGSDVGLGLALYAGPGALDPRRFGERAAAVLRPGLLAIAVQTVVGFALFPLTLDDADPDYSWFGVIPFVTVLLGGGAALLAMLAWVLAVAPVAVLAIRSPAAASGDLVARQAVLLAGLLLAVLGFSTSVALAAGDVGRPGVFSLAALLVGVIEPVPGRGWLLWVGRGVGVLLILLLALLLRVRWAISAEGGDPDAVAPASGKDG